jgi:hypothetical protein
MAETYFSPEERVAARKKVFGDFLDVAQPAKAQQQKSERDSLKRAAMAQTSSQATATPQIQGLGTLGVMTQAAGAAAQMVPQQAAAQDKLNLQGAQQQQEIATAKSGQAVGNVARALESDAQRAARLVADRAFQQGLEAKKLIFHENAALADYSLERLADDLQKGRVNARELQDLKIQLTQRATEKKYAADEALNRAMQEFKADLAAGNAQRAKQRVLDALKAQEDAMKDAARASSIGSIISGTFGIGGVLAAGAASKGVSNG